MSMSMSFPQGDRGPAGPTGPVGEKGPRVSTVTQDILQMSASCLRAGKSQSHSVYTKKGFPKNQQSYNSLPELKNLLEYFSKLMSKDDEYKTEPLTILAVSFGRHY